MLYIRHITILLTGIMLSITGSTARKDVFKVGRIPGNVNLGFVLPVHNRRTGLHACGELDPTSIMRLFTIKYVLHQLNYGSASILEGTGIKIGAYIIDSCHSDAYAMDQALDFIRGRYENNSNNPRIYGVVGAASSTLSIELTNFLRIFHIPQISYESTSEQLSNSERFPFFFRTVTSDAHMVPAMKELLRTFNWTYAAIVYEDSNYGRSAVGIKGALGACFATRQVIPRDTAHAYDGDYDKIIQHIIKKRKVRVILVVALAKDALRIFLAAKRAGVQNRYVWIGTDGWSTELNDHPEVNDVMEGSLAVMTTSSPIEGLESFAKDLLMEEAKVDMSITSRHPWIREFLDKYFKCPKHRKEFRLEHSAEYTNSTVGLNTPAKSSIVYSELCGIEQLINNGGLNMNHLRMDYLANAILAFAHAFKRLHVELCEGQGQRCHVQFQNEIKGDMILRHLSNASFTGIHGEKITFDVHGEPKPRYSLMNYIKDGDSYRWMEVGKFNFQEGESQLDLHSEVVFKEHIRRMPKSECSTSCLSGEVRILTKDGDRRCCWSCAPCEVNEFMKDAYTCEKCDVGTKPNVTQSGCVAIEPIYLSYENPWAIVNMIIASCGICATIVVIGIFYLNKNTTIVKASGGTLNFILLFGVLLSYAVTFILVAKPTGFTCAVSRLIPGLCYTFSYAPVFTKTHRISKLFNKRSFGRHSKDITEKWTVFLTCLLVFVQVPIVGIWLHFDPPGTTLQYNDYQTTILICKGAGDFSYLIGLAYPFVLILFCTLYAIQSRNIPNVFSESRYIAFTMYSTCVIWLAFIPVYMVTLSNIPLRVTSICITLGLDASVTLGMLFGPKAYVILFRQDHNQRDYFLQKTMEFSQKITAHQMNSKLGKHGSHSSLSFDSVAQNKASTPVHSRN